MTTKILNGLTCPVSPQTSDTITLAHGGGGQLSQNLLTQIIQPIFGSDLQSQTDSARLAWSPDSLAFTTDSYVVNPAFFPGGHIGQLAVIGTANDLAMVGADIRFLSCSLIIEEGFDLATLADILSDMQKTATSMNAKIVTGDTKVLEHGKGDGLFINTAGIGQTARTAVGPQQITAGDAIIVSGDLGRHGASIMAHRDNISIDGLLSDLAWLGPQVNALHHAGIEVHCMRDLTRGGLVSALSECANSAQLTFQLRATQIPISDPVQCLCELTGIDPLQLANEGRFVLFCAASHAEQALQILHQFEGSQSAAIIGQVTPRGPHALIQETAYGTTRILVPPLGDQFPRIC